MTHLSLFSGIGGFDLAAEMAGFETVGQCEYADYPTKVLEKHWPDVPRWRDVRTLTKESFYERTGLRTVDVISGGFPCQPFSLAGKRKAQDDDRYLWPEMLRVIRELRPRWVIGENVPGIIDLALDQIIADLEDASYTVQAYLIPACGVDAPHRRYRVFILAHSESECDVGRVFGGEKNASTDGRQRADNGGRTQEFVERERRQDKSRIAGMADGIRTDVHGTDTDADSIEGKGSAENTLFTICSCRESEANVPREHRRTTGMHSAWDNWPDEPDVDRVVDGVPDRVERLKCLGNSVMPQQAYPFFMWIAEELRKEKRHGKD